MVAKRHLLLGTSIAVVLQGGLAVTAVHAVPHAASEQVQAQAQVYDFDIPAQGLGDALRAFARASQQQVTFEDEAVRGKSAQALYGTYTARAALELLLQGTGLEAEKGASGLFIIQAPEAARRQRARSAAGATPRDDSAETTLAAVTVTGTRIRGGTNPSPTLVIDEVQFRQEGFTDLGEVIRSIPQNFSGGENPGVSSGNISGAGLANQNRTGGSGLNLRGLGPDASLTLLNGRRLAYGGFVQAVDISAIPVEAVDRIEIVPDGASAIYGSDAVGGVGNVILKRDFEGVTIGGRIGTATDGGLTTYDYTGTAGNTWSSGGFIATYKDTSTDPIFARQRRYADAVVDPVTLYPGSHLRSGLVSAHQQLGAGVLLRLDGLRTSRNQDYSLLSGGLNNVSTSTTSTFLSPSVAFSLPNGWDITAAGVWGADDTVYYQNNVSMNRVISNECYCNESRTYEVGAEGPLFTLPGGDARLAIGGGHREIEFLQRNLASNTDTTRGKEGVKFAYAEMNLPLVGPRTSATNASRLTLTAAVRGEEYDSFGTNVTPKIGLIYQPGQDFSLKVVWGKAFKAPTLLQRYYEYSVFLYPPTPFGGMGYAQDATVLLTNGGNPDLKPERAKTWSGSLVFHPESMPALRAELTGFYIDYAERVVQPIPNVVQALSNPIYAPFIDYSPTAAEQARVIESADRFLNVAGAPYDPNKVVGIVNLQYLNAARQKIKGLDLSGSYWFDVGPSRMTLRGSVSWLDGTQQVSSTQDPHDLAGTLFNPAKVSGRLGAVLSQGGLSASAFVNYKDGVLDTVKRRTTGSFTTVDTTLRYAMDEGRGVLSGISVALSVHNLFDKSPPLYHPVSSTWTPPYDTTNYSAIGRFVSFSLAKSF